jgi:hypothetical protein
MATVYKQMDYNRASSHAARIPFVASSGAVALGLVSAPVWAGRRLAEVDCRPRHRI